MSNTQPPTSSAPRDEVDERTVVKQERSALVFSIISVVVILLIASPCLCYFGAGLFQGVHILRTGQQTNPAREGYQRQGADWRGKYKRPERYNRKFNKQGDVPQAPVQEPSQKLAPQVQE